MRSLEEQTEQEIWLLGTPTLQRYLEFVEDWASEKPAGRAALADEWRAAHDYYGELENRENGLADHVQCRPLPAALAPLAREVMTDVRYRRAFDTLPTAFGMVELDRLVVYQNRVTQSYVQTLQERLPDPADTAALFHFCFPLRQPETPVDIREAGYGRYVFRSVSTDLRFHTPALLKPSQIIDHASSGPMTAAVALMVGFGSNFLNVVRDEKRCLLHNGYHRACALRALGVTHAPCILQTVANPDELAVAAKPSIAEDYRFYFEAPRPPLLKDYFDPRIRKPITVRRQRQVIEISFDVREYYEPL